MISLSLYRTNPHPPSLPPDSQVKVVKILVKKAFASTNVRASTVKAAQQALLKILELDDTSIFEKARLAIRNGHQDMSLSSSNESSYSRRSPSVNDSSPSPHTRSRHSFGSQSSVLDRRMSRGRSMTPTAFSVKGQDSESQIKSVGETQVSEVMKDRKGKCNKEVLC